MEDVFIGENIIKNLGLLKLCCVIFIIEFYMMNLGLLNGCYKARKPDKRAGSASKAVGIVRCGVQVLWLSYIMRLNLLGASTRWKRVGVVKGMKFDSSGRSKGSGIQSLKVL